MQQTFQPVRIGCSVPRLRDAVAILAKHNHRNCYLIGASQNSDYGRIIVGQTYDQAGFTTLLGLKDITLALAAADQARVPVPSGNVCRERLLGAIAHGDGDKDWAVMAREQARASGLE